MNIGNTLTKGIFTGKKFISCNKETILLVSGIAAGLGTVLLASKGTLAAKDIVKEHKEAVKDINEKAAASEEYKESEERRNDIVKNCVSTTARIAKVYAPSIVMGATSVCCLVAQHKILQNKVSNLEETVASLSAAYIAVDTAFKKYRKRVIDKYGEEVDRQLRFGETTETVDISETDEKGKTKKHKEKVKTVGDLDPSDYAKFFDATSPDFVFQDPQKYKPDWDANIRFLNCKQSFMNNKLEKEGYLFLNDVYEELGIPKTKAGQVVGWIFDPEDKTIDSRVSFGIFNPINHRTINGYEDECILLDFNVDGVIIDKVPGIAEK